MPLSSACARLSTCLRCPCCQCACAACATVILVLVCAGTAGLFTLRVRLTRSFLFTVLLVFRRSDGSFAPRARRSPSLFRFGNSAPDAPRKSAAVTCCMTCPLPGWLDLLSGLTCLRLMTCVLAGVRAVVACFAASCCSDASAAGLVRFLERLDLLENRDLLSD